MNVGWKEVQEVARVRGRSFWLWLSVGWRWSDFKPWRWSGCGFVDGQVQEVDHRPGRSFAHRMSNIWRWSGARAWRCRTQEVVKRLRVVPHVSQAIRNASWHGTVFAINRVRRHQLLAPHACQHHDGAFAKAHIPPTHSLRLKPAKKADGDSTR